MNASKKSNPLLFYFLMIVSYLFFIWEICHAMLDVLNKDFQNILIVSKAQSWPHPDLRLRRLPSHGHAGGPAHSAHWLPAGHSHGAGHTGHRSVSIHSGWI